MHVRRYRRYTHVALLPVALRRRSLPELAPARTQEARKQLRQRLGQTKRMVKSARGSASASILESKDATLEQMQRPGQREPDGAPASARPDSPGRPPVRAVARARAPVRCPGGRLDPQFEHAVARALECRTAEDSNTVLIRCCAWLLQCFQK